MARSPSRRREASPSPEPESGPSRTRRDDTENQNEDGGAALHPSISPEAEAAVQEMQFDFVLVNSRNTDKFIDAAVHRRSTIFLPGPDIEQSATLDLEDDTNDIEAPANKDKEQYTLDDLKAACEAAGNFRFRDYLEVENYQTDVVEGVQHLAAHHFNKRSQLPGFPYQAWALKTLEEKTLPATFRGTLDIEDFKRMSEQDMKSLYREMKLRAFLMMTYKQQCDWYATKAAVMDRNMDTMYEWAKAFAEQAPRSSAQDEDIINTLTVAMREKEAKLADLEGVCSDLAIENRRLTRLAQQASNEPEPTNRIRQPSAAPTEATNVTNAGSTSGNKRTPRAPDIPKFYNDKEKDEVNFDTWYRMLHEKLEVNADHYPTDTAKRIYTSNRLGGKAAEDLEPWLDPENSARLTSSDALFKHLRNEYSNPHKKEEARKDFHKLEMQPGDDYHEFRNRFVRLAGQCGESRENWKMYFKDKLLSSISNTLVLPYANKSISFEEYADLGSEVALNYRMNRQKKDKDNNKSQKEVGSKPAHKNNSSKYGKNGEGTRTATTTTGTTPAAPAAGRPRLSPDEVIKLSREGRCFICKEKDHMANTCPNRQKTEDTRIQALIKKWANPASNKEKFDAPSDKEDEEDEDSSKN